MSVNERHIEEFCNPGFFVQAFNLEFGVNYMYIVLYWFAKGLCMDIREAVRVFLVYIIGSKE